MKSRVLISIAMTLCASLVSFPLAAQQGNNLSSAPREYTLQVLRGPPGLTGAANANSINDQGWVTGISNPPDDTYDRAILWRDGQPTDLGTLGGISSHGPGNNRNDTGWVVGASEIQEPDPNQQNPENFCAFFCPGSTCGTQICKGFLWQSKTNKMIPLPPLPGGKNSFGAGANNETIYGFAEYGPEDTNDCVAPQVFRFEGVVWSLGSDGEPFVSRRLRPFVDDTVPPEMRDTVSAGMGINEVGDIVGTSGLCAPPNGGFGIGQHAVLWKKDGRVINLGNLGGVTGNVAVAINNLGQVVGNSDLPGDPGPHAFLWEEASGMQDLGTLPGDVYSGASAINDSGEVIGLSCNVTAMGLTCRSFHWQRGVMTDVSALPAVSNLLGVTANDINSRGEIPIAANDPNFSDPSDPTGFLQIAAVLIPKQK